MTQQYEISKHDEGGCESPSLVSKACLKWLCLNNNLISWPKGYLES
jgi:hypothetical protein